MEIDFRKFLNAIKVNAKLEILKMASAKIQNPLNGMHLRLRSYFQILLLESRNIICIICIITRYDFNDHY